MKLSYKASPNVRSAQSTSGIMKDLTLCLAAVSVFAIVWYGTSYGAAYGLRVLGMLVSAVVTALACDAVWFKVSKQDVKHSIASSYSWVTAMILVLISPIKASYFAIIVCTAIAVIFGKLVFGGFGQNIFNPAAFGEAVLMTNFASTYSTDFTTSATPAATAKSFSWLLSSGDFASVPSFGELLLGNYPSAIGSTCAVLILLCFVYLLMRKDIDWQAPVFYVLTIFVETLLIALFQGASASTALFHVLAGGVMFGAVFMLTDPVTSPVTIPGRIVFAVGAGTITTILRMRSNLPDGVLFSILLMNALVPAIDMAFDGNQIKDAAKFKKNVVLFSCLFLVIGVAVGATVSNTEAETSSSSASSSTTSSETASSDTTGSGSGETLGEGDYSSASPSAVDNGDGTYSVSAQGFAGELTGTITVEDGAIVSFTDLDGPDNGDGIGDDFFAEGGLDMFIGATLDSSIDSVSGATFTSTAVKGMAQAALEAAGN